MRTVHESAYKPKLIGETKYVVNIRPINQNGVAPSSPAVNTTNAALNDSRLEDGSAARAGVPNAAADAGAMQNNSKVVNRHNSIAEMKCPRICSVSALVVAFLLISGSIYLHLRQKPHLGRLRHEPSTAAGQGIASTLVENDTATSRPPLVVDRLFVPEATAVTAIKTSSATSTTSWSQAASRATITDACMRCLCETVNLCRPAKCRDDVDCGVFRISRFYWLDAGMPTLDDDNGDADTIYTDCVNNMDCATRAVTAYMQKYARDCDSNGVIDCRDQIALHLLGPTGCVQSEGVLAPTFEQRMDDCFK